jgi:hypothetical protein
MTNRLEHLAHLPLFPLMYDNLDQAAILPLLQHPDARWPGSHSINGYTSAPAI